MRVAFLVSAFPVVSETFVLDQITGLIDRGCDVQIFADRRAPAGPTHPEVEAYDLAKRMHVAETPANYLLRPLKAAALSVAGSARGRGERLSSINFLRHGMRAASLRLFFERLSCQGQAAFDAIHCHFGPNGMRGLSLREIGSLQGRLLTTFYGYDVSQLVHGRRHNPYSRLFARGDRFLAVSDDMRLRLIDLGCPEQKIHVHRLGVDVRRFSPRPPDTAGRRPLRLLTVGRLVPKKGLQYALRAVARLLPALPDLEYTLIGDGPDRTGLEALAQQLGIRHAVRLLGGRSRPEVVSQLQQADIMLAPSITADSGDREGTPVAVMEALACAVPVVSTIHAGIPEVVEHGVSGLLVRERNVEELTLALKRLLEDPPLRARMGAQGRQMMERRHDIEKLNDQLLALYGNTGTATG